MRTFFASAAFIYNGAWRDALGSPSHVSQFPVLIVAKTKKAAVEALVEMGENPQAADRLVKGTVATSRLSTPWRLLVDDGIIDLTEPGVFLSEGGRKGSTVVKGTGVASAQVLGEFDHDPVWGGQGLFFVPA